jgi:hypothetical protein
MSQTTPEKQSRSRGKPRQPLYPSQDEANINLLQGKESRRERENPKAKQNPSKHP